MRCQGQRPFIISLPLGMRSVVISVSYVFLAVRSYISKTRVKISSNFRCVLSVVVAQSSDGNAIHCTSGFVDDVMFPYNGVIDPNQRRHACFAHFARWRHRGRSLPSTTACLPLLLAQTLKWFPGDIYLFRQLYPDIMI